MKRSAEELATLSRLLDEALDLPAQARAEWIEQLSGTNADLRPTLRRMLRLAPAQETADFPGFTHHIAAAVHGAISHADAQIPASGARIGPYQLIRELGRGGMGSVWLAERADGAFKRSVALKLPHVDWTGGTVERMARERDILAGLEHPNIARFYDAGVDERGRPFMALEYVEGLPIDVYCREHQLSVEERLRLVLDVAKAVTHAHSRLVVHRDLKPGNILVTPEGAVRLLDFGIAKLLEGESAADARLTQLAGRLLTPDFASPEQIKGESIGTATDVYSLAIITYELLTEARPYKLRRASLAELEQAIAEVDPLPASAAAIEPSRKRRLRGDLDAILNKAMKKNPAERYASMEAFAADLMRHLNGGAVLARPDRVAYRLRKFIGRNRLPLGAAAALFLTIIVGASVSLWQAQRARHQADQARLQADRADQVKRFALSLFDGASIESGGNQQTTARQLLVEARKRVDRELGEQPAMAVEMLSTIGAAYAGLGEQDLALEALREAVKRGDKTQGASHPLSLGARARMASALANAGEVNQAESFARTALAGLQDFPQADPVGLSIAWGVIGAAEFEHGRQTEGVKAFRMAVAVSDAYLPVSNKIDRVNNRVNLVNALQGSDDPTAFAEAERTYRLAREAYGDELAPMLLQARFFYARTMPPERISESIHELEATLVQMRQALGSSHFLVSEILQTLGESRPLIGDTRGAVTAMREYRVMEDALQGDKPTHARGFARLRLGMALLQDGHPHEAVAEMRPVPAMLLAALGPREAGIVDIARVRLALALAESGNIAEADTLVTSAQQLETSSVGNARDIASIASVRRMQGRYADSERLLGLALAQDQKKGTSLDVEGTRLRLAYTWLEAGKAAQALPVLQETWSKMRARHSIDSPPLANVSLALGRAQFAVNDAANAERSLRWAAEFWRRYDPANRTGGVVAAYLARVLEAKGDLTGAGAWRRRAAPLLNADPRAGDRQLLVAFDGQFALMWNRAQLQAIVLTTGGK